MLIMDCIKSSFTLTNRYIILATPLIFFSLISSLYLLFSMKGSLISLLIAIILFALMCVAFVSGWGYMIMICIKDSNREDVNSVIKEFTAGVGEFFLSSLGFIVNIFLLSSLVLGVSYFIGMRFIGDIGITSESITVAMQSTVALKSFLLSLTQEQLLKLNAWNLLLFASMGIEYFLLMFYMPVIFFKTKNPYLAFYIALKDLFCRNFGRNLGLYLIIFVSYFILSMLSSVFNLNVIMHFLYTLASFYYLVFIAVLVFNYYYQNYIQVGGNLNKLIED